MSDFQLIVRAGRVLTDEGFVACDLGLKDGTIVGMDDALLGSCDSELNATGYLVLPGCIDTQVYLSEPGRSDWEGFASGSMALAAGGITTFFDMPVFSDPPVVSVDAFQAKAEAARRESYVDFGIWAGITPDNLHELEDMDAQGAIGFVARLSEGWGDSLPPVDDYFLLEAMKRAAELEQIIAVQAENRAITEHLRTLSLEKGRRAAADYLACHPIVTELEAVQRAILLAYESGCALHLLNVSSARAIELIANARTQGVDVSCAVAPHHLLFTDEDFRTQGALLKTDPPLRPETERQKLMDYFMDGVVDLFASDHCPIPAELKTNEDLFNAAPGIAGGESAFLSLLGFDDAESAASVAARTFSGNAARRFLLHPGKGSLELGSDADLVIVDPNVQPVLEAQMLHSRARSTPYIGKRIGGLVLHTIIRGRPVFHRGAFHRIEPRLVKPQKLMNE